MMILPVKNLQGHKSPDVSDGKDDIAVRRTRLADDFRINGLHEMGHQ